MSTVSSTSTRDLLGEPLLTAYEVGQYMGLHAKTVLTLARRGAIPCVRIGGSIRFRPQDIRECVDRSVVKARAGLGRVAEAPEPAGPEPQKSIGGWRPPSIE